ncbi:MAG: hypothetical protein BGO12_11330 [Verrucomicrobia bacterium 61-8]|nr:VCBS repeat-containing protein [Verrucomicrobiota bacterium]OJV25758.1 MAG: hypothetical protein BGO12_11330 [Verrucomicrobia bacterium 61-8]
MRISSPLAILAVLSVAQSVFAQAPAPAPTPPKALIRNGGFELSRTREDLWDGVDAAGFLAGEREQVPVLMTSGTVADSSMPVSVQVADMNGDSLMDIVTMDPTGYMRIYFNQGTKTEPKFGVAEIVPIFLTRSWIPAAGFKDGVLPSTVRLAPRFALYDSQRSGKNDLYIGNYWGEVLFLKNDGSGAKPDFRQPADISKIVVPTAKGSNTKWGNVFSPAVWDWNRDGKEDLLLGEGSYSANNIHLLINSGSPARPVFEESNRTVIAFGDGREQLSPTVVDYNGDGQPDLLVTERTGKIALHLNDGKPWKPGVELPFTSFLSAGSASGTPISLGGISTITTGDLNGDGLFDIIVGKTNGRVAVIYNTGTKTEPKWGQPVELKGDVGTKPFKLPSGWDVSYGLERGNFYGYMNVVAAADDPEANPPEGKSCLRVGYVPSPNKVMAIPSAGQYTGPLDPKVEHKKADPAGQDRAVEVMRTMPANTYLLRLYGLPVKVDKSYTISFKVKGSGLSAGQVMAAWNMSRKLSDDRKVETGKRDSVQIIRNVIEESGSMEAPFSAGPAWAEVSKDFKLSVKDRKLNDPTSTASGVVEVMFTLAPGSGKVYFDDFKLVEK